MRETEAILIAYDEAKVQGLPCVLATIVHIDGSAYRRAGARMLVDETGMMTGAISGGCLEGDALRKALHALHQDQNKLVTYDTSDKNDAVIGAQLGCNGIIQVLFEPVRFRQADNPVELLRQASDSIHPMVIISLFNLQKTKVQPGTLLLLNQELKTPGNVGNEALLNQIKTDAHLAFNEGTSQFREYSLEGEKQQAFLELITPPPALVLVGAGNDAQVLSQMAALLGWKITITDGRPTHANTTRFVSSCQIIVSKPESILDNLQPDNRTAFVLMTHNYHYDLAVLKLLLPKMEIPYIGVLGPKVKFSKMMEELAADGIHPTEEQLSRVFAPVGLDLGAETSAEIGLSILSEIQAVLTASGVTHLRDKNGPIHKKKNNDFKAIQILPDRVM